MYLDCGYESWVATGNNWCSPYSGWQDIYANDFKTFDAYKSQILGTTESYGGEKVMKSISYSSFMLRRS